VPGAWLSTEYHVSLAGIKLHGLVAQALVWTTGHNTSTARCSGGTECTTGDETSAAVPASYCGNGLWVVITEILLETFHVHCTIPHCSACFGWENVFIDGCSLWLYFTVLQQDRSTGLGGTDSTACIRVGPSTSRHDNFTAPSHDQSEHST